MTSPAEYRYNSPEAAHDDVFLWRAVRRTLVRLAPPPASIFELGCGNGVNARRIAGIPGYAVTATDASASGIEAARSVPSTAVFATASIYEALPERFGVFDVVIALELVEHLFAPRSLPNVALQLLKPGGYALVSTPYHGWLKNIAIASLGRYDAHHNPLWDNGHIKFFSVATLGSLFTEAGFRVLSVQRLGRIPPLARSMLLLAQRPAA